MSLTLRDRVALVAGGAGAAAVLAACWILIAPLTAAVDPLAGAPSADPFAASSEPGHEPSAPTGDLVIDVQGGVVRPGIVVLPAGSRVADAITAAGGYAKQADTLAASASLNLAAPLSDGEQVHVPVQGMVAGPTAGAGGGGGGSGLVNLNSASPEALDALPGIGPVTVQKILAARAERAFTSLDELVERDVMNRGQLDGIRELATI
ncbi:MAG: helix-hairpin-helix domain-containing protein [Candidatus Limnocylindria bacterium]